MKMMACLKNSALIIILILCCQKLMAASQNSRELTLGGSDFSFNWTERNLSVLRPDQPDEYSGFERGLGLEEPILEKKREIQRNSIVPDLFFTRGIDR